MRDIKFRGKRVDNNEWGYGSILSVRDYRYIIPSLSNGSLSLDTHVMKFLNPCFNVIPETVGQFTGLHDKNGKDIYEGDVIHIKHETGLNKWDDSNEVVEFEMGGFSCSIYSEPDNSCDCEVIGNIYENPELLKGGE